MQELLKVAFEDGMREKLPVLHITGMHDNVVRVRDQHERTMWRRGVLPQPSIRIPGQSCASCLSARIIGSRMRLGMH